MQERRRSDEWLLLMLLKAFLFCSVVQAQTVIPEAGGTYYADSDGNDRVDTIAGFEVPFEQSAGLFEAVRRWAEDDAGEESQNQAAAGLRYRLSNQLFTQATAGAAFYGDTVRGAGRGSVAFSAEHYRVELRLERSALYETVEILRNRIMYYGAELQGTVKAAERFSPKILWVLRDYSDDNSSLRFRADLPFALYTKPLVWTLGCRQEYTSYERQSRGGYFDPDRLNSFQLVTALSGEQEDFSGYAEVFGGYQDSRRYGSNASDNFAGFYGEMTYAGFRPFSVSFVGEGGNYALMSDSGFKYLQVTLKLSMPI
ncbi:MAG TPA: hypothetical protein PLP17_04150 [Oligoflexia bacterium]|mgnify:CR=1 FL=1|nr:hypothetical protein [Oligoflexia bacterium]